MSEEREYAIHLDVKPGSLARIDVPEIAAAVTDAWWNQSLCRVNDCVVRLGILKGEFHWHKHDNEDEFFYVVDGTLFIDMEEGTTALAPKQGFTVPKGIRHRTRAPEGVVILMVEGSGVIPTGD